MILELILLQTHLVILSFGIFSNSSYYFWIVGITNTVNLIDGLDGLAAGVSTIATVTILLVALQSGDLPVVFLTAALAGSSLGFCIIILIQQEFSWEIQAVCS